MDDKKVPVLTADEAISKLRLFQRLIASRQWEDKECVVALQMGIRAIQQPEIVRCKDCKHWKSGCYKKSHVRIGQWTGLDWYCADGERKDGDGE